MSDRDKSLNYNKLTILVDFACGYEPESDYDAFVHAMACPTCGDE